MNPLMKNFDVELNITRCIDTGRKVTCSSGLSTLKIKVNDPPVDGNCKITNLGTTEKMDPTNPGFNTALVDIFHIKVLTPKVLLQ